MSFENLSVNDLFNLIKALKNESSVEDSFWKVGKNYFIRTVTHHYTGKLEGIANKELKFSTAAWIADDGRLSETLKNGFYSSSAAEVEPYPNPILINRDCILDATVIDFKLPTEVK